LGCQVAGEAVDDTDREVSCSQIPGPAETLDQFVDSQKCEERDHDLDREAIERGSNQFGIPEPPESDAAPESDCEDE